MLLFFMSIQVHTMSLNRMLLEISRKEGITYLAAHLLPMLLWTESECGFTTTSIKGWNTTIFANTRYSYWRNALQPFIEKGQLDVVDMEFINHTSFNEQQVALQSCHRHYRYASTFVIYDDVDEFFMPLDTRKTVRSVVEQYDKEYPNALAFQVSAAVYMKNRCIMRSLPVI